MKSTNRVLTCTLFAAVAILAAPAIAQVQHGVLDVVENDEHNNSTSVTVTRMGGYGTWEVVHDACSRADYYVDFLTGDDQHTGIMICGPFNDERVEPSVADPYYATVAAVPGGENRYYAAVFRAPQGHEVNYNVALGYFPIGDGWHCGAAYNSANGGPITTFIGHPDIVATNIFDPDIYTYPAAFVDALDGRFGFGIQGIDLRRDGVLLACGAKNEDNHTQVFINYDGTAILNNHDNGDNGEGNEQDPVTFVFIPDGTAGVTMGRVTAAARTIYGQGDFSMEILGAPDIDGTYHLTIADESPATGTLLVSPHTELNGGYMVDNPVFVEPDGDGWLITTRDITGMGLQDVWGSEVLMHFVFFPDDIAVTGPGTPAKPYLDYLETIVSARFDVSEYSAGNGNGENRAERVSGSDKLDNVGDNRGDYATAWLNARMQAYTDNGRDLDDGVFLGNPTEFLRDNSTTGGISGWTTLSYDNGEARLHNASIASGEINADFALAFFPTAAGLIQDADVQIYNDPVDPNLPVDFFVDVDADPVQDGVLLAINWDNNNRSVTVDPNGSEYVLKAWQGDTGERSTDWDCGYVYLPYDLDDNLVAGQIDAAGNVISGTGNFSVGVGSDSLYGFPVTTITIPGVNAATDGVLVVTPAGGPYAMAWEVEGNAFEVAGYDLTNGEIGQRPFSFAWIPNEWTLASPPEICAGDSNCDGGINWRDIDFFVAAQNDNVSAWYDLHMTVYGVAPTCPFENNDVNDDGGVSWRDIDPFVAVQNTTCP